MKPVKHIYPNQKDVWEKASKFLVDKFSKEPAVKELIVWASLAEEKFGLYERTYNGMEGSDIDLVIVIDERKTLPKEWKFTTVVKSWFDLYHLGSFEYQGHKHTIDGLIVSPSRHNMEKMNESLKGRSRKIYG